jgi:hypothetical protein
MYSTAQEMKMKRDLVEVKACDCCQGNRCNKHRQEPEVSQEETHIDEMTSSHAYTEMRFNKARNKVR